MRVTPPPDLSINGNACPPARASVPRWGVRVLLPTCDAALSNVRERAAIVVGRFPGGSLRFSAMTRLSASVACGASR
eukprot:scaffold102792_cov25-Tisochrysis_lutea.AAC.4